jgi:phenylpropionate dioxygenase-like ring-hydroxylating dioxygenase large terminal subunit
VLTREENELLTQTGPGTPGGALLRRYWQPVALVEELPPGGAPLAVRVLGEDLVLFRDDEGRVGLLGLHCAHRGADLSYGRCEDGGLRCLYHGWLYDVTGRCLEQPGEPAGSTFHQRVRQPAYPCAVYGGLIFAYLGPGEPPLLPAYESLVAPDDHRFIRKYHQECNYLQANEGNIDPVHLSFLHRQFPASLARSRPAPGANLTVRGTDETNRALYLRDVSPTIEVEETDYGLRIFTLRRSGEAETYLRVSNFVLPNLCAVPGDMGADGFNVNWHVPIDDSHHWKYMIVFRRSAPLDRGALAEQYAAEVTLDRRLRRNLGNRYQQDRAEMQSEWFSGLGGSFPVHDAFATETQGPIADRTQEHLGSTDLAIAQSRQMLLRAIRGLEDGRDPPHVVRAAEANRFEHLIVRSEVIPASEDWRRHWRAEATAPVLTR